MPRTYAVPPPPPHNEGSTVAAWVNTVGCVLGAIVAAFGLALGDLPIIIAGAVVVVITMIVSFVLRLAGFGQKRTRASAQ